MDADIIERGIRELQRRGGIPEYCYRAIAAAPGVPSGHHYSAVLVNVGSVANDDPLQTHSLYYETLCVMHMGSRQSDVLAAGVLLALEKGWEVTHYSTNIVLVRKAKEVAR